jgi:hypothetical protein
MTKRFFSVRFAYLKGVKRTDDDADSTMGGKSPPDRQRATAPWRRLPLMAMPAGSMETGRETAIYRA